MTNHKSLLKLPATASKIAVTTRFVICPSCRTVGYPRRSSTCQARRHQKERGSALNWGYNSVQSVHQSACNQHTNQRAISTPNSVQSVHQSACNQYTNQQVGEGPRVRGRRQRWDRQWEAEGPLWRPRVGGRQWQTEGDRQQFLAACPPVVWGGLVDAVYWLHAG